MMPGLLARMSYCGCGCLQARIACELGAFGRMLGRVIDRIRLVSENEWVTLVGTQTMQMAMWRPFRFACVGPVLHRLSSGTRLGRHSEMSDVYVAASAVTS